MSGFLLRFRDAALPVAEVIDAYRVFPRVFLGYYLFILLDAHAWYTHLPETDPTQTDYMKWLWGAAGVITVFYFNSGRKWG